MPFMGAIKDVWWVGDVQGEGGVNVGRRGWGRWCLRRVGWVGLGGVGV